MTSRSGALAVPDTGALLSELLAAGLAFEAGVLECLVQREPQNLDFLAALGQTYSQLKDHRRGLAVDRALVAREPDNPTFRYNLACSLALTGDLDGACAEILASIALGYRDFEHLRQDEDLLVLRADRRFVLIEDRIAEVTT